MQRVDLRVLAVLIACMAIVGGQGMMVSPLLPDIATGLAAGIADIGYALGAYGLATAVSALIAAKFLDRLPRRRAISAAMLLLAVALSLSATSLSPWMLGAGQALAGGCAGVLLPSVYAYAGDIAPPHERARVVGRVLLGWSIALVAAIPAGGFLGAVIGWRGVYAVAALAAALGAAAALTLPRVARLELPPPSYRASLAIPAVVPVLLACLADMTGFYAMYAYLGAAIRAEHAGSSGLAAIAVLAYGAGFTLAQPLGRVIDRLGAPRAMVVAMASLSAIFLLMPRALPVFPLFCVAIAALGAVQYVALNTIVSVILAAAIERRGAVMSLNTVVTYIGVLVGAAAMGPVFERSGFSTVTTFSAACLALAAAAGVWLSRILRTPSPSG